MDSKILIEAIREGNLELIQNSIKENKTSVDDIAFISVSESLLHTATKSGKVRVVKELLKSNYKLGRELNGDGFRPLDIAAIMGNVEIVKELIKVDPEICLLKGKDRKTALHHAATKGRVAVIEDLASIFQDSLKDTTVHGETALHLAVKSYQFEAFQALVKWLEIHELQEIINWGDHNGNTVLHLAASTKQYECLELLLKKSNIRAAVNSNAKNSNGLTAIDVFDIVMANADDLHSREILEQAGIVKSKAAASNNASQNSHPQSHNQQNTADYYGAKSSLDWVEYFKFQVQRDSPSDTRNVILLIATLIATVTFQAVLQPPPAILANNFLLIVFFFCNTLAVSASTCIIASFTRGFPFHMELMIGMVSMMMAYGVAVGATGASRESTVFLPIGQFLIAVCTMLPVTLLWLPKYLKTVWEKGWSRPSHLPM